MNAVLCISRDERQLLNGQRRAKSTEVLELLYHPRNIQCLQMLRTLLKCQDVQLTTSFEDLLRRPRPHDSYLTEDNASLPDANWLIEIRTHLFEKSPSCWDHFKDVVGAAEYADKDLRRLCAETSGISSETSSSTGKRTSVGGGWNKRRYSTLEGSAHEQGADDVLTAHKTRGNFQAEAGDLLSNQSSSRQCPGSNTLGLTFTSPVRVNCGTPHYPMKTIPEEQVAIFDTEERTQAKEQIQTEKVFESFSEASGIARYATLGMLTPPPERRQVFKVLVS